MYYAFDVFAKFLKFSFLQLLPFHGSLPPLRTNTIPLCGFSLRHTGDRACSERGKPNFSSCSRPKFDQRFLWQKSCKQIFRLSFYQSIYWSWSATAWFKFNL